MNDLVKQSYDITEIGEKFKLCQSLAKSRLIPTALQGKPEDVFIVLQHGFELGLAPMQSLSSIYVVQGNPTSSGQLMLALIRRDCPNAVILIETDDKAMIVRVKMARNKDQPTYISEWSMDRANTMGITGKDNWKKQPLTMLKWRAVADAARTVFPDVIKGLYVTDELDYISEKDKTKTEQKETAEKLTDKLLS
jgi:hypothetical protein